jgi:NTE family protein
MEQLVEKVRLLNLVDPILKNWLIKGDKIKTYLESLFWEKRIEDSNIALKIIATDIDTGKKKVFHTGKISEAVRASISIPGIFEPCEINGKRFVDGGLTENIPVSVLKNKNIIAVSALRDISRSTKKETKLLGMTFENPFATSYVIMQKA